MARRSQELKVECYLIKSNGETVPWEETTQEDRDEFLRNGEKRGSRALSQYYTQHPDEFKNFPTKN